MGVTDYISDMAAEAKKSAEDTVKLVAKDRMINGFPGAGILFTHDFDNGFKLLPIGQALALAAAAYGLVKMAGN